MLEQIADAVEPVLVEAVALAIVALLTWITARFNSYLGVKTTDKLRDMLDEALMNGFLQADTRDPDALAVSIVAYVKAGIPDAVVKLKASDGSLLRRARATIKQFGMANAAGSDGAA